MIPLGEEKENVVSVANVACKKRHEMNIPGFQATTIRTFLVKVVGALQKSCSIRVSLTLHRKPIVDMSIAPEQVEQFRPDLSALPGIHECATIPNHDECVPCSGQQNIQPLGRTHEADIMGRIASRKGCDHNFALFALVIV